MNSRENSSDLRELAACLFDLRAALESEVRTLTWIQRSIEGIRNGEPCGDPDLLLREIARLFGEASGASAAAGHRNDARAILAAMIAERDRAAAPATPFAIVA